MERVDSDEVEDESCSGVDVLLRALAQGDDPDPELAAALQEQDCAQSAPGSAQPSPPLSLPSTPPRPRASPCLPRQATADGAAMQDAGQKSPKRTLVASPAKQYPKSDSTAELECANASANASGDEAPAANADVEDVGSPTLTNHPRSPVANHSVIEALGVSAPTSPLGECKTPNETTPGGDAECSSSANRHVVAGAEGTASAHVLESSDCEKEKAAEEKLDLELQEDSIRRGSALSSDHRPSVGTLYECVDTPVEPVGGTLGLADDTLHGASGELEKSLAPVIESKSADNLNPHYEALDEMHLAREVVSLSPGVSASSISSEGQLSTHSGVSDDPGLGDDDGEEIPAMSYEEEREELRKTRAGKQARPTQALEASLKASLVAQSSIPAATRGVTSPVASLLTTMDSALPLGAQTASEPDGTVESTTDEDSQLMRKMVVMGIVDGEKLYLEVLHIMINNYYKPLIAVATSSQPIVSLRDCDAIFNNLPSIIDVHDSMNKMLEPLLADWHSTTEVGAALELLVKEVPVYKGYLDNYPRAIDLVTRYRQESGAFTAFLKAAGSIKGLKKNVPFEELLQMPVQRLQNYTLVMQDLLRYTPPSHSDHALLSSLVEKLGAFLVAFNSARAAGGSETQCGRKLIKHCLCVEVMTDGRRKFRHIFLYEDTLMCCTTSYRSKQKEKHELKWYVPLSDLSVNPSADGEDILTLCAVSQSELNALSLKVNKYKQELKQIHLAMADTRRRQKKHSDKEKVRKRLIESEMTLKMMLANSCVKFGHKSSKVRILGIQPFAILFFGDDEAKDFEDAVLKATQEAHQVDLTQFEVSDMMAKSRLEVELLNAEAMAQDEDEDENIELLDGLMTVYIEGALCLKPTLLDVICIMELDTYGHFERKAKTRPQSNNGAPTFNQGFEIELEATQCLIITIVEKGLKVKGRQIGKVSLDLLPYCDEGPHLIDVPIQPQGALSLRLQYFTPEEAAHRVEILKAHTSTSVFGQSIETVSLRENNLVPAIVRICCAEVEKRGLDETGIYRISGLLSDVRNLKQAFDTSIGQAQALAEEVDVHAVSGCLKLYFREMPEPIFPRSMYTKFVEGLGLSNPEARLSCLLSLLYSIPDPNLMTAIHLIKHLKVVSANSGENKMHNQNLSTVFGPNLFKPEGKSDEQDMSAALDVVSQVGVFVFFMELHPDVLLIEDRMPTATPQQPSVGFVKGHHRGASGSSTVNVSGLVAAANAAASASTTQISPGQPRKFFRKT